MRRHKSDRLIGVLTLVLLAIGLIVIYAVGPMRANYLSSMGQEVGENYYFIRQLENVVISVGVFILAFIVPYEWIRKWGKYVFYVGVLACVALAIMVLAGSSMAVCANGACRWIRLFGISVQPAEILKLGLILYLAQLAAERKKEDLLNKSDFFLPVIVASAVSLGFVIVAQKDLGSGAVLMAIILAILLVSGVKLKWVGLAGLVVVIAGVGLILSSSHRMERVMTFINGDGANSYHIENAEIAIGTGGMFGVGVGNTVQATGYLPESINDSVFAIMGETFGFVGLMAVVGTFTILLLRIAKIAENGGEDEHKLIAVGVFSWVMSQMVINVMAMTGLIPLTGITLPLLSYGGTSMMFVAAGLGICLQLSCYTKREISSEKEKPGERRRK